MSTSPPTSAAAAAATTASTISLPAQAQHHDQNQDDHESDVSHSTPSLFSALSYPVSYTVSGLIRRIAADDAPTPLARALSANYNGSMVSSTSSFLPPPSAPGRRSSPFQPPPLTPLTFSGYKSNTGGKGRLLGKAIAEEIRLLIPPRLQLVDEWKLIYSLEQDGSSIGSLYGLCDKYRGKRGGFVVTVRDGTSGILGAYLSDPPHPSAHYYGTGECFLWRCFRLPSLPDLHSLPPPPSEDTTNLGRMTTITLHQSANSSSTSLASVSLPTSSRTSSPSRQNQAAGSTPASSVATLQSQAAANAARQLQQQRQQEQQQPVRFQAFPYTGDNDFLILCGHDYLSVGGGDGKYGLWLDDRLARGLSSECATFANEPLSEEGARFDVLGVEVWYVGS